MGLSSQLPLPKDSGILELDMDEDIEIPLNKCTLIGWIKAYKLVNKKGMKRLLQQAWNPRMGVATSDVKTHSYANFGEKKILGASRMGVPRIVMGEELQLEASYFVVIISGSDQFENAFTDPFKFGYNNFWKSKIWV